jgi:WbqC-like protein family
MEPLGALTMRAAERQANRGPIPLHVPGKRLAIVQSSYIPWKGYFDLINSVDEFVLFDDVQYTRRDWRNRNRIKTPTGLAWLSIPVSSKGNFEAPIKQIQVEDASWAGRHWRTIRSNYARAAHFRAYADVLEPLYLQCDELHLSAINRRFLSAICDVLGIRTKISWSWEYEILPGKTERLVSICRQAKADIYISGPSAAAYIDAQQFENAGIELVYFDYGGYPSYQQLFPPFEHSVSVLDLILNEGPEAPRYMLSF